MAGQAGAIDGVQAAQPDDAGVQVVNAPFQPVAAPDVAQAAAQAVAVQGVAVPPVGQFGLQAAVAAQNGVGLWQGSALHDGWLQQKSQDYNRLDNMGNIPPGELPVSDHRRILGSYSQRQLDIEVAVLLRLLVAKTRQIEKATYNAEARSDSAAGLPSDMDRHYASYTARMAAARQARDEPQVASLADEWRIWRRDWLYTAAGQGCFNFLWTYNQLPKKL